MADDYNGIALRALSFGKDLYKKSKNVVLKVSEIEAKVKEATNSDAWGPSGTVLNDISAATTDDQQKAIILSTLWERLREPGHNWRKVYKALNVLEYCVKNGTRRFVEDVRDNVDRIEDCQRFNFIEADTGKDVGLNVREKSKVLAELLLNTEKLAEEREKARRARDRFRHGGSGAGSDNFCGRSTAGWDKPDRDDVLSDWAVAKKAVKDEDEEEERDALRKKTIDERDSLRTVTRAETHGHDPSESRISGSKQSAIGGGRATRAGLDDDWDVRRSRQAAAQEARRNTKEDDWVESHPGGSAAPHASSLSSGNITMNINTKVTSSNKPKKQAKHTVVTAATPSPSVPAAAAPPAKSSPPAIDLLELDCGGGARNQSNSEDEWSKFEAVGVGGRNQVHPTTLYSGSTLPGGGGFNGYTGGLGNAQITASPSIGFGDFHSVQTASAAPVHFNSFANPSPSDAGLAEGFGGFVSVNANAASDFPVSFGGDSSSDLLGDFDSTQVQPTASITPAKAAVASLVNLDNLNISAKEAQAASAASGAAAKIKSGPMKALVSNKNNALGGTVGMGASSPGMGAGGFYGMSGSGGMGGMGQSMTGHVAGMTSQMGGGFGGTNTMYGTGMGMGSQMGGMGIGPGFQMGGMNMGGFQMGGGSGMESAGMGTGGTIGGGGWQGTGGAGPSGGGFRSGNPFMS